MKEKQVEYKFNVKNDILEMRVTLPSRSRNKEPRIRFGRPSAFNLVKQYDCPDNIVLGECLTPNNYLDNFYSDKVEGVWLFKLNNLAPKPVKQKKVAEKKKVTRRRTSTKKENSS